jgi:hypothetical protein
MTWRRDGPHADLPPSPNLLPTNVLNYPQHGRRKDVMDPVTWKQIPVPSRHRTLILQSFTSHYNHRCLGPRQNYMYFVTHRSTAWSQDSLVGIATGWTTEVRFPVRATYFSPFHIVQTGFGAQPASYPVGTGVKRSRREGDHSPPSSADVTNGGAIPPLSRTSLWYDV